METLPAQANNRISQNLPIGKTTASPGIFIPRTSEVVIKNEYLFHVVSEYNSTALEY